MRWDVGGDGVVGGFMGGWVGGWVSGWRVHRVGGGVGS